MGRHQKDNESKELVTSVDRHVGFSMRRRRKELRITQQKLAAILGISYQQVQKYETGSNRISAGRLFHIAQVLGVDPNYFYEGLLKGNGSDDVWSASDSKWEMNSRVRDALANLVDALKK